MQVSPNVDSLYGTMTARLDTIGSFKQDDVKFWLAIRKANQDYEVNGEHGYYEPSQKYFMKWLEEQWGIKIYMTDSGNYSTVYDVVSPDKYTMFVLKYSV